MISIGFSRPGDNWIGKEIDRLTGGLGFCHAFLYFHDLGLVHEAHADFGVRFKARPVGAHEVLFSLDLTPEQEQAMHRKASLLAGDGYDFAGVTHFRLRFVKECPDKEFCSEAVVLIGREAGLFAAMDVASDISPNALYAVVSRAA